MSYSFAADSEKMDNLKTELKKTSKEIDGYITDIYSKIDDLGTVWVGEDYDAFKTKSASYKPALEYLVEVLDSFAAETSGLGGDASTMVVSIKSLLDVSGLVIASGTGKTGNVSLSNRAKDKNGAYIPDKNTYSDKFTIPADTKVGSECWACAEVGDDLYIKALEIENGINFELEALKNFKNTKVNDIANLDASQKAVLLNYINAEIDRREEISTKLSKATKDAAIFGDGALFNCTSYGLTGNSVVGWTQQSTVDTAVKCAKEVNEKLKTLSDFSDIEAYVLDCGLGSIGG